jgi:hypothetical protein
VCATDNLDSDEPLVPGPFDSLHEGDVFDKAGNLIGTADDEEANLFTLASDPDW